MVLHVNQKGGKEFVEVKRYPNVGVARKQSGFESDRKLIKPHEEKSFRKSYFKPLEKHFKQQLRKFRREKYLQIIPVNSMPRRMQEVIRNKSSATKY